MKAGNMARRLLIAALALALIAGYQPEHILQTFSGRTLPQKPAGGLEGPVPLPLPLPQQPDSSGAAALTPDFRPMVAEKQRLNSDTVGWLEIPGTDISREVVQNPDGKGNNYYLNVGFDGQPDRDGTFCADYRSRFGSGSREELSRNTVLYGHSWDDDPDGSLFSQLKRFRDPEFARKTPYIYFSTATQTMAWEVIAVFEATVELPYNMPNLSRDTFFDTLELVLESSLYRYNAAVGPEDKLLTLSTCVFSVQGHQRLPAVNDYRFAVMARLADPGAPLREEADFVVNADPLSADEATRLMWEGAVRSYTYGSELNGKPV